MLIAVPTPHYSRVLARAASAAKAGLLLFCTAAAAAAASSPVQGNKCTSDNQEVNVDVGVTSKTATFACGSELANLLPPQEAERFAKCYDSEECRTPVDFTAAVGADVGLAVSGRTASKEEATGTTYEVTVQKLPARPKTVFFLCSKDAAPQGKESTKPCTVKVAIPAKPPADTCAEDKENIIVEVDATQKSTTFNCGGDLASLAPVDSTRVYKEDCSTEASLEDEVPSAKLTKQELKHTLALTELPKAEKTICYKCTRAAGKSAATKECTVKVKVPSSGGQSVAAQASASILTGVVLAVTFVL